jgi:hypothetical protein
LPEATEPFGTAEWVVLVSLFVSSIDWLSRGQRIDRRDLRDNMREGCRVAPVAAGLLGYSDRPRFGASVREPAMSLNVSGRFWAEINYRGRTLPRQSNPILVRVEPHQIVLDNAEDCVWIENGALCTLDGVRLVASSVNRDTGSFEFEFCDRADDGVNPISLRTE